MVIIVNISSISKSIYKDINTNCYGKVHSVYKNTINIMINNKLISLQPDNIYKSPMSINIDKSLFHKLNIKNGETVNFQNGKFTIHNITFICSAVQIWDPKLNCLEISPDRKTIDLLNNILMTYGNEEGLRDLSLITSDYNYELNMSCSYMNKLVQKVFPDVVRLINQNEVLSAIYNLTALIGLGHGLTPSVDDFLLGLLSVLFNVSNSSRISQIKKSLIGGIHKYGSSTTSISYEYLKYGCKNEFSEIFHKFYKALEDKDFNELSIATMALLNLGHTSGSDTLSGIIVGLILINKKEEANNVNLQ